ncbi:MAG: cytochrome b [Alphaproteobacteria bacterium]|nr:cytochrome b [Alphaproteobacteria bacterium]
MLKNTLNSFGTVAKAFHWIMAIAIIGMLTVGFIMADMDPSPSKWTLYTLHKSTGVVILTLVILRLTWRLRGPVPQLPSTLRPIHHHFAKLSPIALYSLMFLMPLSGFILSQTGGHPISFYGLFTLPTILPKNLDLSMFAGTIHTYGGYAFVGVLGLHLSAGLFHHFILKNNVLTRMLPNWFHRR